ncbi:MAG: hypothetical protein Kow0047_08210 [Anaerolineae bacterium]
MTDWWRDWPWRLIQTNLREIDMLDIDARRVVADLLEFKATVLMINAAGIIASYPTRLPFHFQSPYLKGDSLQQIIDACHKANIRVIARTDFSKVRRPIYEMHPEWAYISPKGEIVDYNGDVHVCVNSEYQQERALEIIGECLTELEFDGIFFNMGGYQTRDYSGNYYGICHCANCQRRFEEMFGLPLPEVEDLEDPVYRKYRQFQRETIRELHLKISHFINGLRPGICIAGHLETRRGFVRQESNTALDRPLPHWQYSASDNTKWVVTNYPAMVSSNAAVDFIDFPYRHVAVSPHQQRLRLAQNLANAGGLDFYLIGRLDNHQDRSSFEPVKEMFHYHAAHEEEYRNLQSKAEIALLNGPFANTHEYRGWYRFLAESHYPFDVLLSETATEMDLGRYRAIVIPDLQAISDTLARRLDQYVRHGGELIAVGRPGFRDEHYEPRRRTCLECLGIEEVLYQRDDMRSAYLTLEGDPQRDAFSHLRHSELVYLEGPYVYARYAEDVQRRLKLIPPHWFGPPERCYYTQVTDHPGFTVRAFGEGKAIYIPWLPGKLFYRQGHTNTFDFVADLLQAIGQLQPVGGNLSPMVEVTRHASADGQYELIHLVNGSGHFGVTFYEPVPMTDITISIPSVQRPQRVLSLVSAQEYEHAWADGVLTIHVPQLRFFDAIKVIAA